MVVVYTETQLSVLVANLPDKLHPYSRKQRNDLPGNTPADWLFGPSIKVT